MSFTGTTVAAPTNVVDDVAAESFTVKIPPVDEVLSDPFSPDNPSGMNTPTIGDDWTTIQGSPVIASAKVSSGSGTTIVGNTGMGDGFSIFGSFGNTPTSGGAYVYFCSILLGNGYSFGWTATALTLYKNGVAEDTVSAVPGAGESWQIDVIEGGAINVLVDGVQTLTSADDTNRGQTGVALVLGGDASVGVDPTLLALVIKPYEAP